MTYTGVGPAAAHEHPRKANRDFKSSSAAIKRAAEHPAPLEAPRGTEELKTPASAQTDEDYLGESDEQMRV